MGLTSLTLIPSDQIRGQDTDSILQIASRFHIEGNLGVTWPLENFNRKFDEVSFTAGGGVSYKILKDEFIYLQLKAQWYSLDRVQTEYAQIIDNIQLNLRHTSTSAVLDIKTGIKYEGPQIFYIIPFAYFLGGARNSYLYSSIVDQFDDEEIEGFRSESDWSYLYSIGGGVQVPITQSYHIWLSGTYSSTGSLDIPLPVNETSNVNSIYPEDYFEIRRSAMSLFDLRLGLSIYLN